MDKPRLTKKVRFIESSKLSLRKRPNWYCFCCEDTGFININLVKLVLPEYELNQLVPICQRYDCDAAFNKIGTEPLTSSDMDDRFDADICYYLDQENRKLWYQWQEEDQEIKDQIEKLSEEF